MERESKQPNEQFKKKRFPVLALILGFLPSVLILGFITFMRDLDSSVALKPALFTIAALSLVCCIISSTMLFKRRTVLAILGGLVLLILNTLIVLFLGCTASVSDMF